MIISLALILGAAFGNIPPSFLFLLALTWIPDVAIFAILKGY